MKSNITNSQLRFDLEKHLSANEIRIKADSYFNEIGQVWCIDINDDSYIYYHPAKRNDDLKICKQIFKSTLIS